MLAKIARLLLYVLESYIFVILAALLAGMLFPSEAAVFAPFATLFLQIIFFLSSLKMDAVGVLREARDLRLIAAFNFLKLIALPAAAFIVAGWLAPPLAVPLLLLAAMPSGMTSPLLAEVAGGKQGLAMVLTFTSALLAPFTIPIVIGAFARTAVTVDAFTMFLGLLKVIVVPFAAAQIVRRFWHDRLKITFFTFKPISIALLGLLIAGAVAKQSGVISANHWLRTLSLLAILFVLGGAMLFASYFLAWRRPCEDKLTVSVSLSFMNFVLAVYLAGSYFKDPAVLLTTVMVIFPWALLLWPFKYVVGRFVCPPNAPRKATTSN